jgi:hypothetical protein
VNPCQTVYAGGKGKNQTTNFELATGFNAGDEVVIRDYVVDEGGLPLADATVEIIINDDTGTSVACLPAGPSDAAGMAEAAWQSQKPNKKRIGGTRKVSSEAVTNNVTLSGYVWDGVRTDSQFDFQLTGYIRNFDAQGGCGQRPPFLGLAIRQLESSFDNRCDNLV